MRQLIELKVSPQDHTECIIVVSRRDKIYKFVNRSIPCLDNQSYVEFQKWNHLFQNLDESVWFRMRYFKTDYKSELAQIVEPDLCLLCLRMYTFWVSMIKVLWHAG